MEVINNERDTMESLAQLKAYLEEMALKQALKVRSMKELQERGETPDYGSMEASNIGKVIGMLGGDEWKRNVREFDNSPLYHKFGMTRNEFRDHIPDWILDQSIRPKADIIDREGLSPFEILLQNFRQRNH